jgi:sec-independent protein translocase protein TatC
MPWPWELSALWPEKFSPRHDLDWFSHLEELRQRLIICLLVFLGATFLSYFFSETLIEIFTRPLRSFGDSELIFQKPYEAFFIRLKAAALGGLILSSPVLFIQSWFFISPALYAREKNIILSFSVISAALFLTGILFAYFIVVPWTLQFFLNYQTPTLRPFLDIGAYFSFVMGMEIAFGVLFIFPVFLVGLVKVGVTSAKTLAKARRGMVVFIFILAAILTPSPDPASQLLLAVPLILLFEISLLVARFLEPSRN